MSDDLEQMPFGGAPFLENPEPRCPCVLLMDTSYSMRGAPIEAVNKALAALKADLDSDALAAKRVEVALVTFGPVRVVQPFRTADEFEPPRLTAADDTPMGEAIQEAIALVETRKELYRQNGIAYYRPWIFLVTDGAPSDGERWRDAARLVAEGEGSNAFAFFAVGVADANMDILGRIAPRGAHKLDGLKFRELFAWLSNSLRRVSQSRVGDKVSLDKPDWNEV